MARSASLHSRTDKTVNLLVYLNYLPSFLPLLSSSFYHFLMITITVQSLQHFAFCCSSSFPSSMQYPRGSTNNSWLHADISWCLIHCMTREPPCFHPVRPDPTPILRPQGQRTSCCFATNLSLLYRLNSCSEFEA